ncbi:MAG: class II fructose-bisphosphatase [Anaerolineae bacterium]
MTLRGTDMHDHTNRNWGLDLVRATEAAAIAAGRWMGFGQRDTADRAAAEAMHTMLDTFDMDGTIVVGEEGRLGSASPLATGQRIGQGGPALDIVVDAVDGLNLLALGHAGAIAVAGATARNAMWSPAPAIYVEKIVADRDLAGALVAECMDAPAAWTLALVARLKRKEVRDLVVFVLDRPRHANLIEEIRRAGARIMLRRDGDIAGALLAASPDRPVDLLMGIGGAPEGVIGACAVKALGGAMVARLAPQSDAERAAVEAAGLDTRRILTCDEIITSDQVFFAATGITDGTLLDGVQYRGNQAQTQSLVLRCDSRTRRHVYTEHFL